MVNSNLRASRILVTVRAHRREPSSTEDVPGDGTVLRHTADRPLHGTMNGAPVVEIMTGNTRLFPTAEHALAGGRRGANRWR